MHAIHAGILAAASVFAAVAPPSWEQNDGTAGGRQEDRTFAVFVSLPTNDGFADVTEALLASDGYVRLAIQRHQDLRLVDRTSDADAVLVVLARGEGGTDLSGAMERHKAPTLAGSPLSIGQRERFIHAMLLVGPTHCDGHVTAKTTDAECYRRSLVGMGFAYYERSARNAVEANSWDACAEAIAKDLRAWLTTNANKVRSLRRGR